MDVDSSSKSGASSMVPLGVGLLGLGVGVIALFMSLNSASKAQLAALTDNVASVSSKADAAKSAADSVVSKVDQNASAITALRSNAVDAFKTVGDTLAQHTTDIAALKAGGGRTSTAGTGRSGTGATSSVGPNGGTHVVVAGDYLGTIAKKYGLTLKEVEDANPGVDSAHLRIGQKITIPAPRSSGSSTRGASTPTTSGSTGAAPAVTNP